MAGPTRWHADSAPRSSAQPDWFASAAEPAARDEAAAGGAHAEFYFDEGDVAKSYSAALQARAVERRADGKVSAYSIGEAPFDRRRPSTSTGDPAARTVVAVVVLDPHRDQHGLNNEEPSSWSMPCPASTATR